MGRLLQVAIAGLALQASFGPDRRQGLGVGSMVAPVAGLWRTLDDRRRFLLRHLENFNTNPAMAGPLMGAIIRLEERAAAGDVQALERVIKVKRSLEGPFAATGDRLLWVGMRSCAAVVVGIVGWLVGGAWAAFCFLVLYNLVHLGIRLGGVFWGYHHALQVPIGSRGDVRGTPVAAGGILVGLILAYGSGSQGP